MALPDVVVVGAGIGGLAAALAFLQRGASVTVLERAPAIAEVGAGIQISPNGYRQLDALGVADAVRTAAFAPEVIEMRLGSTGQTLVTIPMGAAAQARWQAPYLQVHRADLIEALRRAVEAHSPACIRTGAELASFDQDDNQATAVLVNGDRVSGSILIGADGVRSVVRDGLFGAEAPQFTGMVAWRTTVASDSLGNIDLPKGACIWAGSDRHAVTYPVRQGRVVNFVGMIEQDDWRTEGWSVPGAKAELHTHFDGWAAPLRRVIERADQPFKWALYGRGPMQSWSRGRVVLLGDAAHPMLPSLAQGACQALEDAVLLARKCTGSSHQVAFEDYFNARIDRVTRVQKEAQANLRRFHWSSPLQALPVRVVAGLAPAWFHRRLDWLYGQ